MTTDDFACGKYRRLPLAWFKFYMDKMMDLCWVAKKQWQRSQNVIKHRRVNNSLFLNCEFGTTRWVANSFHVGLFTCRIAIVEDMERWDTLCCSKKIATHFVTSIVPQHALGFLCHLKKVHAEKGAACQCVSVLEAQWFHLFFHTGPLNERGNEGHTRNDSNLQGQESAEYNWVASDEQR